MAIQTNSSSDDDLDVMSEMNTTPLIDVMLVLLVMLIITIPVQLNAVNLEMPVGVPPPPQSEPQVVRIGVTATNQILWNGEPLADAQALMERLQASATQAEQPEVHVQPHRQAKYDTVATVLASAQRLGLQKIGIVANENSAP